MMGSKKISSYRLHAAISSNGYLTRLMRSFYLWFLRKPLLIRDIQMLDVTLYDEIPSSRDSALRGNYNATKRKIYTGLADS